MSWLRVGKVLGALAALVVIFVVVVSDSPLRAPLIALAALVFLVAAGNLLNDWLGIRRTAPLFEDPHKEPVEDPARAAEDPEG